MYSAFRPADEMFGDTLQSQSAPVEILSSQVKSRRLGDKKSNFLRRMKGSDANSNDVEGKPEISAQEVLFLFGRTRRETYLSR